MNKQINLLLNQNTSLNELQFALVGKIHGDNIRGIYDQLMRSGLDEKSLGFWVWNIKDNIELYSPRFRASLQYSGEEDFPSVPDSWMNAIFPEDKILAINNFHKHVKSGGRESYMQRVRYNKKYKGVLEVICHGIIVSYSEDHPSVMVGVHLNKNGLFEKGT